MTAPAFSPQDTTATAPVTLPALPLDQVRNIVAAMQHAFPAEHVRINRGLQVLLGSQILETATTGRYLVQSSQDSGLYYAATSLHCSCPDAQRHGAEGLRCKHSWGVDLLHTATAIAAREQAEAATAAPPVAAQDADVLDLDPDAPIPFELTAQAYRALSGVPVMAGGSGAPDPQHVHLLYHGGVDWCGPTAEGQRLYAQWSAAADGYTLQLVAGEHARCWGPPPYGYYVGPAQGPDPDDERDVCQLCQDPDPSDPHPHHRDSAPTSRDQVLAASEAALVALQRGAALGPPPTTQEAACPHCGRVRGVVRDGEPVRCFGCHRHWQPAPSVA